MLTDDFVMRQIQKIAELCAALVESGDPPDGLEGDIADAYQALTGLPATMIDRLDGASLAGLVSGPEAAAALAELLVADATRLEKEGDSERAARRTLSAAQLRRARGADPT